MLNNPNVDKKFRRLHRDLFKPMAIPLCSVVILICFKDMSLSYVFAERYIESYYNGTQLSAQQFRNNSQLYAEAVANINAMWAGLHAIGLYSVLAGDPCVLWVFSVLETLASVLVMIYWTGGFYPLV